MTDHQALETIFNQHGYTDFQWIDPQEIVVAQWVRMKCTFGCSEYGHNACCPPQTPSVPECRQFFSEYSTAAIFHFATAVNKPDDRHDWTKGINLGLSRLEREVFLAGYRKTFLLFMDSCCLCSKCKEIRTECKNAPMARPAPEAMAVDVYETVKKVGYPIQVLTDYDQVMNRYAFLMIE